MITFASTSFYVDMKRFVFGLTVLLGSMMTMMPGYGQVAVDVYELPVVYPMQQEAVGEARMDIAEQTTDDGTLTRYTLYNNVLAASFVRSGGALMFGGCEAMNLRGGTELFSLALGEGEKVVNASEMILRSVRTKALEAEPDAVNGACHFAGQQIEANYKYVDDGRVLEVVWRAVLRDGSHYLRTEMELLGRTDVDMFNVVPMMYSVDVAEAGSVPVVVGNTRGAVIMNDRIFAGLETPMGYNTVGNGADDEDKWELVSRLASTSLTAGSWQKMEAGLVPARVVEATGYGYPNIYCYSREGVALEKGHRLEVGINYRSGNHRLNFGGVDLLDANGAVVASDYHSGFSGNKAENNVFSMVVPSSGNFTLRAFVEDGTESIDASSVMDVAVYKAKEGVVIDDDVVSIKGRWSRNTVLQNGETWKVSAVVGLIAQDGMEGNADILKTQKRRSFLAYSERERAVPWRPFPCYISWYELNINRNNAADPTQNMNANQVMDVVRHWKEDFYDVYGTAPAAFVIDDGWDNYGTWTFHSGFPNEMRDIAALADEMGSGVGAWLGPVGGYGQSGNYRRAYWSNMGQSMVLGNRNYYNVFLDAAANLVRNQGTDDEGRGLFRFFKFDGISAQFSATGPDSGDSGNENAEGIIRLERYVRENLKEDIFFNTTVGTWASPFWYHYTDATWRQENDYDRIGDNASSRENWITYRDRLVYQNYVCNSPICPINTLMTHGFILSRYGNVSNDYGYDAVRRELRCAFACGSGLVELYNDYELMNSINGGKLWGDLAECIEWQRRNADVLPDAHWVGGNPWDGSRAAVYGWASWNGPKATLALRNGGTTAQMYLTTLREMLNIPANVSGSILFKKAFADQKALNGLSESAPIDIDRVLTLRLPASSVYVFDGTDEDYEDPTGIENSGQRTDNNGQWSTADGQSIYDLQGRRLQAPPQKGLYIRNGKVRGN